MKITRIAEGFITAAIILVLLQTLAEDILLITPTPWSIRQIFIFTGFGFDLLFTLEFLIRGWNAFNTGKLKKYFLYENGWVDFVASVPLLMLSSAPTLINHLQGISFAGAGALIGMLKIVKAVRIARVLRLLRLLRLFQRIRFANAGMVQRHTVRIVTIIATTFIVFNMILGTLFTFFHVSDAKSTLQNEQMGFAKYITLGWGTSAVSNEMLINIALTNLSTMRIDVDGETLYMRNSEDYFRKYFGPGDYVVYELDKYTIWFDVSPLAVSSAMANLTIFLSTLAVILMILIAYSPHFAVTVSDPAIIMMKGMKEKSYNHEVKVSKNFAEDEIFQLAHLYNEEYLPMKDRNNTENLDISLNDIQDILKS
ncbi:MAG: hypothetical protein B0D92_02635 [Spirochaeta sp. LUC14_002_19_P3]|nr:MAG: hypothetical protein B0D92_02635 [Spirochaeta sp. LUC14_002_19_P3]